MMASTHAFMHPCIYADGQTYIHDMRAFMSICLHAYLQTCAHASSDLSTAQRPSSAVLSEGPPRQTATASFETIALAEESNFNMCIHLRTCISKMYVCVVI